jgi:type IV pilus assembly protein PilC
MAKLNMPIAKGLKIMGKEVTERNFRKLIEAVQNDLEEGKPLEEALRKYPESFTNMYLEMLKAGESTGNLAVILDELTEYSETMMNVSTKIRDAMVYPVVVSFVTLAFVLYFLLFAAPQFRMNFLAAGIPVARMPAVTRLTFFLSDLLYKPLFSIPFFILLAALVVGAAWKFKKGWDQFDEYMFRIPVFGKLFLKATLLKVCRTMRDLLANGVSMVHALRLTSRTIGNNRIQKKLEEIRAAVEEGESFSRVLGEGMVFPDTMVWKLQMGEEKGIVEDALTELTKEFAVEIDVTTSHLTKIIGPVMLMIIALIVGLLVASFYLPLFESLRVAYH